MATVKIDLAGHAEEYASYGWALVQLDGKAPKGHGWQNALPVDPESARSIWQDKDCNMGLILGPSGVIDYEMDGGTEEEFLFLVGGSIPDTPAYRTGSGKLHILFRAPAGMTRRTREGFELRAGSHQSVIPPSIHPDTGEPYVWVNDPATYPLADPPQSLLDFFAEETPGGTNEGHWRNALTADQKLSTGEGRHASMVSYLGMAVNQFVSAEQLVAAAIAFAQVTQDPPYPDDVIEKQALDIWYRYRVEEEDEAETLKVVRASQITMRSISFLWKPFLQRSAFHLFVGKKGAGKGTMLTWLAAQMTQGFMDVDTGVVADPRGVLWVSTEDSFEIDVKPRFIAQGGDEDLLFCVQQRVQLPSDEEKLRTTCLRHNIGMVIIDPIISTLEKGSDANDEASVVSAIGCLNALSDELDMTVIGVRHLGKSLDRGPLESVLGSAAWVNTPRAVLGLAQDEDTKTATLEILAGNRVRGRVSFDFKINEAHVDGVEEAVSKAIPLDFSTTSMHDVLKRDKGSKVPLIKEWLIERLSNGEAVAQVDLIPEVVAEFGVGRSTLGRACTELKEEGLIRYVPNEVDPLTGRKKEGSKWNIVRAVPEEL